MVLTLLGVCTCLKSRLKEHTRVPEKLEMCTCTNSLDVKRPPCHSSEGLYWIKYCCVTNYPEIQWGPKKWHCIIISHGFMGWLRTSSAGFPGLIHAAAFSWSVAWAERFSLTDLIVGAGCWMKCLTSPLCGFLSSSKAHQLAYMVVIGQHYSFWNQVSRTYKKSVLPHAKDQNKFRVYPDLRGQNTGSTWMKQLQKTCSRI